MRKTRDQVFNRYKKKKVNIGKIVVSTGFSCVEEGFKYFTGLRGGEKIIVLCRNVQIF